LQTAPAPSEFLNLHEIIAKARANLNQNNWDYIVGATETETTLRRNRMALDSIAFRPRILRDVSKIDASVNQFGRKLRLPVMLAPVGSLESFHEEGAAPIVRGAHEFGAAHMLSSVCEPGLEKVAQAAPDAARIFQLYVRGDDAFVDDHVSRAIANGYAAFCLTVDTAIYSRRERDIAKRYQTAGRRRFRPRIPGGARLAHGQAPQGSVQDPARAQRHCHRRGRQDRDRAWRRLDYISNHGGRQLDHGRGSMDVLPEVVDAVAGRAKI
jgi:glycolate oxidase